jgi:hypothetical protein
VSDIVDTINRLEAWVRNYGHEKQPAFIADLRVLIGAAKTISRAVDWLQKAQRYDVDPMGDYYQGEGMVHSNSGDYVDIVDVMAAIDILQGGQQ